MKHLLFDLDQTLFDFKLAERNALSLALTQIGIQVDESIIKQYSALNQKMWEMLENGEIDKKRLRVERFNRLKEKLNIHYDTMQVSQLYTEYLGKQGILFDGAFDVLKECSQYVECSVASNGLKEVQLERIKQAKIAPFFKHIFISEEIGAEKPDIKYFNYILEKLNLEKEEIAFVGDSLNADITGGVNAGFMTIWYNPKHLENTYKIQPDMEIADLKELVDIVKKNC